MSRMLRASAIMAAGTMVSRLTGFARTAVLASAIGVAVLGDAYNVAYTIPFILFDLLIGGVLSSVIVPMIVKAQKHDADGGRAYEQRLMTVTTMALIAIAVAGVICAPLLIELLTTNFTPRATEVATTLARYILPQIAFFGVGAIAGAILNTRDRFAAPMWAPVLNNLVVIGSACLPLPQPRGREHPRGHRRRPGPSRARHHRGHRDPVDVLVIACTERASGSCPGSTCATRGSARWAGPGCWTLAFVVFSQLGFIVTTNLATGATAKAIEQKAGHVAGLASYSYAFQLFQLPYGIIAVSVITAMLPRMSRFVHEGELGAIREEFASGVRLVSSVIVPAGLLLMVLGPAVTVLIFSWEHLRGLRANIGNVLQVFGLALVPFSIYQLLLRVFYSFGDTRTPALIAVGNVAVNTALSFIPTSRSPPIHRDGAGGGLQRRVRRRRGGRVEAREPQGGRRPRREARRLRAVAHVHRAPPSRRLRARRPVGDQGAGRDDALSSAIMLVAGGGLGGASTSRRPSRMRIAEISSIIGLVAGRVGRSHR